MYGEYAAVVVLATMDERALRENIGDSSITIDDVEPLFADHADANAIVPPRLARPLVVSSQLLLANGVVVLLLGLPWLAAACFVCWVTRYDRRERMELGCSQHYRC